MKSKVKHVKIIGLTATPFRTADSEQGRLSKIYTDGVNLGKPVKGNKGITYKTDFNTLFNRSIFSRPIFESYNTKEGFGDTSG